MGNDSPSLGARTQFVDVDGRRLAYRTFGSGTPLVLCVRFRGTMDTWDPLFLDSLVEQGFQVTIFDYSGLGQSTGERTYHPASLAKDAIDLIVALELGKAVIGGWSVGGMAAQIVLAKAPQLVTHAVLIATTPPGQLVKAGEPLFYTMAKRENDFEDFVTLFFEPASAASRAAAEQAAARVAQRKVDLSRRCRSRGPGSRSATARGTRPSRSMPCSMRCGRRRFRFFMSAAITTSCSRWRTGMRSTASFRRCIS